MFPDLVPARPFQTKEEYIYDTLRTAILTCKLIPGEKLVIDRLTSTFGTSTIPIRTALQRLEAEGLVQIVPHAGAVVSEISVQQIEEIFSILAALEAVAFEHAAQKVSETDLAELEQMVTDMDQSVEEKAFDRWSEQNRQFHRTVTRIAGMDLLADLTDRTLNYWERIRRYYLNEMVSDRLPVANAEHHEMLDLLRQHKGKELAVKVSMHNWRAKEAYLRLIEKQKGLK